MNNKDSERLINTTIDFLKEFADKGYENAVECIDWVKKQGEHANFRNKIQIGDKVTRNEDGLLVNLSQLNRIAKEYNITSISSKNAQGKLGEMIKNLKSVKEVLEQKPQGKTALEAINEEKVDNANKVEPKDYSSIDPHFGKPIDKVEPKFHEGDWVVNKFGDAWHIDSFDKKNYQVSDGKGNYNYFPISKQDEMHLYTIEDAKDGDILVYEDSIFIFNEIHENWLIYYGIYENDKFRNDKCYSYLDLDTIDSNIIYPATKEEHITLIKAMAGAGYIFDFEKKELKKIDWDKFIKYVQNCLPIAK